VLQFQFTPAESFVAAATAVVAPVAIAAGGRIDSVTSIALCIVLPLLLQAALPTDPSRSINTESFPRFITGLTLICRSNCTGPKTAARRIGGTRRRQIRSNTRTLARFGVERNSGNLVPI
jgi:hypothetical protein